MEYLADDRDADSVELATECGDMFRVVLTPALAAQRQLGLLVVLERNKPLQLAILRDLPVRAIRRNQFPSKLPHRFEI